MFRTSRITFTIASAVATMLLLAACQAGASSPSAAPSEAAPSEAAPSVQASAAEPVESESAAPMAHTVEVASSATLDDYLADAEGRTLYIFLNDSPGETSCFDTCLQSWPAFTADAGTSPTAGDGVTGTLGTIQRSDDGSTQVTLEGWPLYYFAADAAPGDTNGQGVGGVWFVARPDGSVPSASAASRSAYDY